MCHIFISYKRQNDTSFSKDPSFIPLLRTRLETKFNVWQDIDIPAGEPWSPEIDRKIEQAFAVIVILTEDASKSEYMTYEWSMALGKGKKIIPLLREKEAHVHPRLKELQILDFYDPEEKKLAWDDLFERLQKIQSDITSPPKPTNPLPNLLRDILQRYRLNDVVEIEDVISEFASAKIIDPVTQAELMDLAIKRRENIAQTRKNLEA